MSTSEHGDPVAEFIDFLRRNGIPPEYPAQIIADDKVNRYMVAGDKKKSKNGAYRLATEGDFGYGWAKSFKAGISVNFHSKSMATITPKEKAEIDRKIKQAQEQTTKATHKANEAATAKALEMWNKARPAEADHPYLVKKQIPPGSLKQLGQDLLIPIFDNRKKLWNLQQIGHNGFKLFLKGGRIKGCYHQIGRPRPMQNDPYIFCEGYATAVTLSQATGYPVVAALNANNLLPTACYFRGRNHYAHFIYGADNDKWTTRQDGTPHNPGIHHANAAKRKTGGQIITVPAWVQEKYEQQRPTDLNDMANLVGLDEVTKLFFPQGRT